MPSFKVLAAEVGKKIPAKDDRPELAVQHLTLGANGNRIEVSRAKRASAPLPEVGSMLTGTLEDDRFDANRKKFVDERSGGGFGGGNSAAKDAYWKAKDQRDIEGIFRMGRAHAQDMALRAVAMLGVPDSPDKLRKALKAWTGWFQEDVDNAVPAPTPFPLPPTDVPADTEGLDTPPVGNDEDIPF